MKLLFTNIKTFNFTILYLVALLITGHIQAAESNDKDKVTVSQSELNDIRVALEEQKNTISLVLENLNNYQSLESKVESINEALITIEKVHNLKTEPKQRSINLETKMESVESSINTIYERDDFFSYADWAAIAITCVAVLLTVVGLAIAGLAFWGFREIKELTKNSAAAEAKVVAEKTMEETLNSVVKSELEKLINNGKLREPLQDAVDMILRNESDSSTRTAALFDELDKNELDIDEFESERSNNEQHQ
ncbi:hypothetical protein [Pseudoalteromonas sp. Angola-7]|uniref:hypothetical protein n=1 Tax=Pseudoalteromonas sp. Angola-7 TaxID=3025336 RepID=UPI002359C184|nr:hypothetical protein [Pseudoalteromonas sp. Angola-7]MDC9529174.1 hypothetical protein [Pseudoalteromonas sp. Angola-7]